MMGHRRRRGPRSAPPPPTRCRRRSTASSTSTGCVVDVVDGRYVAAARRPGEQRAGRVAAANGLALLPDGEGVAAGDDITVMLLD